jgi:hypothetical protein
MQTTFAAVPTMLVHDSLNGKQSTPDLPQIQNPY